MKVKLKRIAHNKHGTFGVLIGPDGPLCFTLEDPWKNNQKNISCIPSGEYEVGSHNGVKYKDVWQIKDVPGRTYILIHNGNNQDHTQGCVLVGQSVYAGKSISNSRVTLDMLRHFLPDNFTLTIEDCDGKDRSVERD